jgi:hypothetical protein
MSEAKQRVVSEATRKQLEFAMEKHMAVMRKLYDEYGYGHAPAQFVGFQEDVTETFALDMIMSIHVGLLRNIELLKALRDNSVTNKVLDICQQIRDIEIPE